MMLQTAGAGRNYRFIRAGNRQIEPRLHRIGFIIFAQSIQAFHESVEAPQIICVL